MVVDFHRKQTDELADYTIVWTRNIIDKNRIMNANIYGNITKWK